MTDFRRLEVGELAHALTLDLYRETRRFPTDERFGLVSQIRRAGVSIGASLAEGSARGSKEFAHYIRNGTRLLERVGVLGPRGVRSHLPRSGLVSRTTSGG